MIEKNSIINGLNTHYYQSDMFDPHGAVVFLHGWGSQAADLKGIFSQCVNAVAIDLPGFGKSEKPRKPWTTRDYAEFLGIFLEKQDITDPILVGHSFGGSIIIKYCSTHPQVKKIILIGSAGIRNKPLRLVFYKIGATMFNLIFSLPILKTFKMRMRKKFYASIGSEDYLHAGEMKETFQNIIDEDLRKDMKKVTAEALLIWGEDDTETPLAIAREMSVLLPKARLFTIPGADHYAFLDNVTEFDKIFFAQLP